MRVSLEKELILNIDPVFDEIAAESRQAFPGKSVRRTPAAPVGDIRVVDDEAVIVRPVETVVEGGAELFDQVMSLFGGWIHESIPKGDFQFPGDDIFSDLRVPAISLPELHGGTEDDCGGRVERNGARISVSHPLVPVISLTL